jgi:hypothetical protein
MQTKNHYIVIIVIPQITPKNAIHFTDAFLKFAILLRSVGGPLQGRPEGGGTIRAIWSGDPAEGAPKIRI